MGRVRVLDIPRLRGVVGADVRPVVAERRRVEQTLPVAIDVRLLKIHRLLPRKLSEGRLTGLGVRDPLSLKALKIGVHLERRSTSLADVLGVRRERLLLTLLAISRPKVLLKSVAFGGFGGFGGFGPAPTPDAPTPCAASHSGTRGSRHPRSG
jgi:hypothetical protein